MKTAGEIAVGSAEVLCSALAHTSVSRVLHNYRMCPREQYFMMMHRAGGAAGRTEPSSLSRRVQHWLNSLPGASTGSRACTSS